MDLHLPTLLTVCLAAVAASAGVMTLYGATQRVYRGFAWWVAAQWLLALGGLLLLLRDGAPELLPLAGLLLLQWPVVVLGGMRRFSLRRPGRAHAALDGLLLAGVWLAWLSTGTAAGQLAAGAVAFSTGACVLHLYAALTLWQMDQARRSAAVRMLILVLLATVALQALRVADGLAGQDGGGRSLLLGSGLMIVVSSLVMVYLALMLTTERRETQLREAQRRLRYLADIDVLTRVPNRRHFHELAAQTLAEGMQPPRALMMFDVDHFKQINDRLGHAAGDEALRRVARCMRDSLRTQDIAGRLGGDEFAVLLPATGMDEAMGVAARIVAQLADRTGAAPAPPLGLSFGIVQMHDDEALEDALHRADQALYEAKRQGRSRAVQAFGPQERPVFGESRPLGLSGS